VWFKKKPEPRPAFPIGAYALNMTLREGPPLRELLPAEYEVMGRQFVGEKIYHAPEVEFVGKRWNLTLGAVRGRLYKIAPFLELKNKNEANEAGFGALTFCNEQLGKPAEQRTGLFVWDTTDGNVILQTAEAKDGFTVSLFLTARNVREFQRLG
jgi:hypothetical protein